IVRAACRLAEKPTSCAVKTSQSRHRASPVASNFGERNELACGHTRDRLAVLVPPLRYRAGDPDSVLVSADAPLPYPGFGAGRRERHIANASVHWSAR